MWICLQNLSNQKEQPLARNIFESRVADPHCLMRIRIQHFFNLRIRIQGFDNPKLEKKFLSKIAIYLSVDLGKGCPSYRRNLQPSKENIQYFKT
jgi:hypothetical protein